MLHLALGRIGSASTDSSIGTPSRSARSTAGRTRSRRPRRSGRRPAPSPAWIWSISSSIRALNWLHRHEARHVDGQEELAHPAPCPPGFPRRSPSIPPNRPPDEHAGQHVQHDRHAVPFVAADRLQRALPAPRPGRWSGCRPCRGPSRAGSTRPWSGQRPACRQPPRWSPCPAPSATRGWSARPSRTGCCR